MPDEMHLGTLTWFNGFGWFPHHYGFDMRSDEGAGNEKRRRAASGTCCSITAWDRAAWRRGRGGLCTDEIRVKPGTKLRARGFFKAIGAHGPCFVNFEGDPGDGWERIDLPREADYDWTEVTGVVTVEPPRRGKKPDEQGNVRIHVFIYTKAFGELWIDDITLTPVDQ